MADAAVPLRADADVVSLVHEGGVNYRLTLADLELLAPNEAELRALVPAFFRVAMRRAIPEMSRTGPSQYPRSALQIFRQLYGGYLIAGKVYSRAEFRDGRYHVQLTGGLDREALAAKFLDGEVRVTNPNGAAESAIWRSSPSRETRMVPLPRAMDSPVPRTRSTGFPIGVRVSISRTRKTSESGR